MHKFKNFLIQSIVFSDIKFQWVHFGPLVLTTPVTVARLTLHKLYMDLSDRWKNNIIILNIFFDKYNFTCNTSLFVPADNG